MRTDARSTTRIETFYRFQVLNIISPIWVDELNIDRVLVFLNVTTTTP
jgi:hypothetical protein